MKAQLKVSADLNEVTDLEPHDDKENPFEYTFLIQCQRCHEIHDRPVTFNRFEHYEAKGSRGSFNLVFRCKGCQTEHTVAVERTKRKLTNEDVGKSVPILDIDSRGLELLEFIPLGAFRCRGAGSPTVFDNVDISENEWYDYDDKAVKEVSIVGVKWEITS